jgi:5-methylcytosine-specific restriction enzyme subunit McrC
MLPLSIREYGKIKKAEENKYDFQANILWLESNSYQNLEAFAQTNEEKSQELGQIFKFGRDFLQVQNFVGVIETKDGTQIEILPKIYQVDNEQVTREIFLKMLRCLQDSPFLQLNEAHLHTTDFPILEVFITIFLQSLEKLVQKGIRKNYVSEEANQPFLKGKLLVNQQIKHNFSHAERFFVQYDDFQENIAPNRLIKSTLQLLFKVSRQLVNQVSLSQNLLIFAEVDSVRNLAQDLAETEKMNRQFAHYQSVMAWCRFFLQHQSFTNFSGSAVNFALLFPMEKIFEDFVGAKVRQNLSRPNWRISLQDRKHYLLENPQKFQLKPDIVFYQNDSPKIILDAKWKLLNDKEKKFDISQADLYQLFAYGKKYGCNNLYLIYPKNENFTKPLIFKYDKNEQDKNEDDKKKDNKNMILRIYPIDLSSV